MDFIIPFVTVLSFYCLFKKSVIFITLFITIFLGHWAEALVGDSAFFD